MMSSRAHALGGQRHRQSPRPRTPQLSIITRRRTGAAQPTRPGVNPTTAAAAANAAANADADADDALIPGQGITPTDRAHMRRALELARLGLGKTAPNPAVGCVVVDAQGAIVGEGYHPRAGLPHAEVYALRAAGNAAEGATAYVTLEPCGHHGRTPPCAEALRDARVARVVVGCADPNPLVAGGGGLAALRAAGVEVALVDGDEQRLCRELNPAFMAQMEAEAARRRAEEEARR